MFVTFVLFLDVGTVGAKFSFGLFSSRCQVCGTERINNKGLFKKNLLFQNWKCHAYSNGKRSTVPESLIITALETVFLPKKFTRKRVQEMGEVTLVARKYC